MRTIQLIIYTLN